MGLMLWDHKAKPSLRLTNRPLHPRKIGLTLADLMDLRAVRKINQRGALLLANLKVLCQMENGPRQSGNRIAITNGREVHRMMKIQLAIKNHDAINREAINREAINREAKIRVIQNNLGRVRRASAKRLVQLIPPENASSLRHASLMLPSLHRPMSV
jgi:hypothetical protein